MTVNNLFSPRQDRLWLHCILSFLTIFMLGILDNGSVMLTELSRPAVWLSMLFLSVIVLFGQALTREWILFAYKGKYKTLLTGFIGIPLGIFFLYGLFYLLRNFQA
jgi:hypothetical protein